MFRKLIPCVLALLGSAALAGAAPILDGLVSKAEYPVTVDDTYVYNAPDETGMQYYMTGLDIDYVGFDIDASYVYAGVATKDQFMPAGSPGSMFGQTAVAIAFYTSPPNPQAVPPSEPLWYVNLVVSDNGIEQAMLVQNPVAGDTVTMDLINGFMKVGAVKTIENWIPAMFGATVGADVPGKGLEVWMDDGLFTAIDPLTAPYFTLQLDDLGAWPDDQMVGMIPEPATIFVIMAGGLPALLKRRRRRS